MSIFIELSPTETRDQYLPRITENKLYHIDPEFLNRYFLANSADPDQTAPACLFICIF